MFLTLYDLLCLKKKRLLNFIKYYMHFSSIYHIDLNSQCCHLATITNFLENQVF